MVRHHHGIALAIALLLALILAVPASARFARALPSASTHPGHPASTSTVASVSAPSDGFHWGDAGIGAGALGLTMLVLGGAVTVTQTRRRTARGSMQATT